MRLRRATIAFVSALAILTAAGEVLPDTHRDAQAGPESEMPAYNAPQRLTPRGRIGGGLRGSGGNDPAVAALVPDHVGMTAKQHPELNWFLSAHTSLPIQFTLIDEHSIQALVERSVAAPKRPGVQAIRLSDIDVALQPNVQYRWYISVIKDIGSPSRNIVSGGMIERCEFSECMVLDATTTCSPDAVFISAANGFWYDAMGCLSNLIELSPDDRGLRKQRAALLKQVGLHEVAEWDLSATDAGRLSMSAR
jgi:uncharacterized protein DUF928